MSGAFRDAELEAYLDEALPADEMARIETALRTNSELAARLAAINARRDSGVHSLGDIWRRHRITCPDRTELGSFLLGVLETGHAAYVRFHLEVVGCRLCQANLADLQQQQAEAAGAASRRRRYLKSSAGLLRKKR
jgi:anti-sigma factor RsiW